MTRLDEIEARLAANPGPLNYSRVSEAEARYLLAVARAAEAMADFLSEGIEPLDRLYELRTDLDAALMEYLDRAHPRGRRAGE